MINVKIAPTPIDTASTSPTEGLTFNENPHNRNGSRLGSKSVADASLIPVTVCRYYEAKFDTKLYLKKTFLVLQFVYLYTFWPTVALNSISVMKQHA